MPSPRSAVAWLLEKDWQELMSSRAWWLMLALIGPLVGVCFGDGVRSFSEVSAGAGIGCGIACDPLIGVWGPTFSAFEIAAVFLLPFVAIRLVSGDRLSGAGKLELQRPLSPVFRIGSKAAVLMAGWVIALTAGLVAVVLWKSYGGHVNAAELAVVVIGQLLNAGLTIALAVALATMTEHPSTAAIGTLAFTIGTWIVQFAAAIHGGLWDRIARLTPSALVATFQHGLLRIDLILTALALTAGGMATSAVWMRLGTSVRVRLFDTLGIAATTAVVVFICTFARGSWDSTESRFNSFSEPEEELLETLKTPLSIDVHLAPQDPRRVQLERSALAKLERAVPDLTVTYSARTTSGLYEQQDQHYGEIVYALNGRQATTRMVTDEGALETIFDLMGTKPPEESEMPYRGYPLETRPKGAALAFYVAWPVLVGGLGFKVMRRTT